MNRKPPTARAMTLAELVVVLAVVAVLVILAIPRQRIATGSGIMTLAINHARQIHLATFNMTTDGKVQSDERLALPGDLRNAKSEAARVRTVSEFMQRLVEYDYLKVSDVAELCSAPGVTPWSGVDMKTFDGDKNCAFKIYATTAKDSANAIFCATKNFTYNAPLDPKKQPFGDKGFIIVRMGGDGAQYRAKSSKSLQTLGLLPGRTRFDVDDKELPEDTLLQK